MSVVLVDTGPLVALLDRSDSGHDWAVEVFKSLRPPLLTCEAVLAETWHLLGDSGPSRGALAQLHASGIQGTARIIPCATKRKSRGRRGLPRLDVWMTRRVGPSIEARGYQCRY